MPPVCARSEPADLSINALIDSRSYLLLSFPNPSGVISGDGVTIGWKGDHQVTLRWPSGVKPISGPRSAGGIEVSYRAFSPDLSNVTVENTRQLSLNDVSVNFWEVDTQWGHARYMATGLPVPEIHALLRSARVTVRYLTGLLYN